MGNQDKALVKRADLRPAVQAVYAELADGTEPRVLLQGVDTIYFSFMTEVSDAMWERLQDEKDEAHLREHERKAQYAPDWLGAVIGTTGARGGYAFRIEHADFTIKLIKHVPNRPGIVVEMRSFGLHVHPGGVIGACEAACSYIRAILMSDWPVLEAQRRINLDEAICSRLDLHVDWQGGWMPTYTTGEDRMFLRPGRCDWHPFVSGNTCTGYRFGSGKVLARLYNKTIDVKKKHLDWYPKLLEVCCGTNYNPALPLWRLEFQLLREGIKGFKLYAKPEVTDPDDQIQAELDNEDLPHIGSVRKALHWAGKIWEYLTQRWLRLVEEGEDQNRARWQTHPTWQVLQQGFAKAMVGAPITEEKAELVRKERHTGYARFLHRIELGVLALVDAQDTDPAATAHAWLAHLARCLELAKIKQDGRIMTGAGVDQVLKGLGVNGGNAHRKHTLKAVLDEVLGLFTGSGVAKLGMRDVAMVADLLCEIIDDLEAVAEDKGGLGLLLEEKRCKLYKLSGQRFFKQALVA